MHIAWVLAPVICIFVRLLGRCLLEVPTYSEIVWDSQVAAECHRSSSVTLSQPLPPHNMSTDRMGDWILHRAAGCVYNVLLCAPPSVLLPFPPI